MKKLTVLAFVSLLSLGSLFSQIDSLVRILPKLKGDKKVNTLFDISFNYASNNPNKSSYYGNWALKEAKKLKNKKLILESYNILSISYMCSSKYDSVIYISNKAIHLANEINDILAKGKAFNKIALVNFELGKHKESIQYNFKALKIFDQEKQLLYQGMTLLNIAISYEKLELYQKASANYNRVLAIAKILDSPDLLANSYGNIGIIQMKQLKFEEAAKSYGNALKYILLLNDKSKLATLYQNMGVNARSQKNSKLGINYYLNSLKLYKELQDQTGIGFVYNNLANSYLDINELNFAKSYIDSGFVIGKKLNSLGLIRNSYKSLSRFENAKGNFENADKYFDEYEKYKDSILNISKFKAISEIQTKYDVQEKEKQILEERVKNAEVSKILYATLGITGSLGLILLAVWHRSAIRLKNNELETINKLNKERNRIARDLHDNLGAELTVVSSKLDTKIYKTEKNHEKCELQEIANLTRNASVVLRETVWSIKAEKLTVFSLKNKLEEFVQRLETPNILNVQFSTIGSEFSLSPTIALNFFRIGQEAIINALKYSEAKNINLTLSPNKLVIMDDGNGFDPKNVKRGYGLNNMEFRAKEIDAVLEIKSDNFGSQISISIQGM